MPKINRPRHGSLQFYPRKRVRKFLPSANWRPVIDSSTIKDKECLLGFIGYKVGMSSAIVKDNTDKSMTKGKKIALPVTILEVPKMKVFSVRFYKDGKVIGEQVVSNDKELKRKVKISKTAVKELSEVKDFDDIRVIVYSVIRESKLKKTPDMIEVGISSPDKIGFVKNLIGKELSLADFLKYELVDVRGLTKGKGFQGPVKRFGIDLRAHKSEKGIRKVGSIGPWHPARVTFRVPMAGQMGTFTRIHYNLNVLGSGNINEKNINRNEGFKNYGKIRTNYIILAGSVQGPQKRQILVSPAMRPTKKQSKKKYEFVELVR